MKNIQPVTLREREVQAQPGEQSEEDGACTRPSRARQENLGQRLGKALAAETDIDATSGTKHTDTVQPAEFLVILTSFASNKEEAAEEVRRHTDGSDEQSFSTDGSSLEISKTRENMAWRQTD